MLESICRRLDKLAPIRYRFAPEAQRIYQDYHWQLEQRKLAEPRQGIRSTIAKMQGYTARIAGILHILWDVTIDQIPEPLIPAERVKAAQELADFYLGQVRLIYSDGEAAQGELTSILESILKKARQLGQLPTRIAKASIKAFRKVKTETILEYFKELEAMGYGRVDGKTFIPQSVNCDRPNTNCVDPMLTQMLTAPLMATAIDGRLSQPLDKKNVDLVDPVDRFSGQEQKQKELEQPGRSSPLVEVEPEPSITLNNSQQSQQINIPDQSLSQPNIECVDWRSTSESTISEESTISLPPGAIAPSPAPGDEPFKIGDRVWWDNCPGHFEQMNPFAIRSIDGDRVMLDYIECPVTLTALRRLP